MDIQHTNFPSSSIAKMQDMYPSSVSKNVKANTKLSFNDILTSKAAWDMQNGNVPKNNGTLKFSKHASSRLEERNIELSDSQLERLQEGTMKAEAKGINESLVIVDSLSFIVNVPNNTVITALSQSDSEDNIYTNIDGAVII